MKMKTLKLILKIIGGIIGLIIIGIILLFIFFPTEKVKEIAIEQMQKQLHRQVQIGKVGLNLFKGIVIKDVRISDRPNFKKGTFISCKAFVFKYDLWKLLQRKLVIKKLVLEQPEIFVKRYIENKKVVFNFSDLLPPMPKKLPEKKEEKPREEAKKKTPSKPMPEIRKSQIPVDLQIGKLGLEKAKIEIVDTATPKFKEIYTLYNIHFLIENLRIYENRPLKISTGFGLSVTEFEKGQKTDKDINLEAKIGGVLKLFDKKGVLNPTGEFILALRNGKFTGIQAYEELRNQAQEISKSITAYQEKLLVSYKKIAEQVAKNQKTLSKAGKIAGTVSDTSRKLDALAKKIAEIDLSFIKGALDWKFLKKTFEFDEVKTKLKIQESKIISDKIGLTAQDFRAEGSGYTGFDTTVDYVFTLIADKKYNKNEITKALANDKGELEFPIKVTGTISDTKIIFEKAEIISKIQNQLKERFMAQFKTKAGGMDDLAKQYLQNYVNQLFGEKAKYITSGKETVKAVKQEAKAKIEAEKKRLEEEAKKKEEELRRKAEEERKRLEAEKKKKEEEAKKKAMEEAKKKLKKFGW